MNKEIHNRLKHMSERQDKIFEKILVLMQGQARVQENLKEHMRRTELAEKAVDLLFNELKPVKKHINNIEGGMKLLGLVSLLATVGAAIYSMFF